MVRWLEANGYNVSYFTGVDSDRRGELISNTRCSCRSATTSTGPAGSAPTSRPPAHAGVHLAFFSGNEVFWKTRWENSIDGSGTPYRTLVCLQGDARQRQDRSEPPTWTGTWRDPRFSPPADGGRPENALTGTIFMVNDWQRSRFEVPGRRTANAVLAQHECRDPGARQTATLPNGTLGYEWDEDLDNGFRPAGLIRLSIDHGQRRPVPAGLRLDLRPGHGDAHA